MSEPSRAVFLSYASEDAEVAARIADALTAAGIEVWLDKSELRGGDRWDRKIRQQIRDCALFMPVVSAHTEARREGYFRREWRLAADRLLDMDDDVAFLVPVVVDVTPEKGAHVPEAFRAAHWTRLPNGGVTPAFVNRVAALLEGHPAEAAGPTAAPVPGRPPSSRRRVIRVTAWAALCLLVVVFTAAAILESRRQRTGAETEHGPTYSATALADRSIAVLPFSDLSESKDLEYFGEGMAEEILNDLAKLPELTVIGRRSSFRFKNRSEDLREIGQQLHAAYLLEGSVRRAGRRIRVTPELSDVATGTRVWSNDYDRDLVDVLAVQQEIAASIARALQIAVDVSSVQSTHHLANREAYALYLRGLNALDQLHPEPLLQAKSLFEQALGLDPQFVPAVEGLAVAYFEIGQDEDIVPHQAWRGAESAAERALALDPHSVTAHAVLGYVHAFDDFEWARGEAELEQALSVNRRNAMALLLAAQVAMARGHIQDASERIHAASAADPLNPGVEQNLGFLMEASGDFDSAQSAFRRSLAIAPGTDGSHFAIAELLLARRQPEAALIELAAENSADAKDCGLALAYDALGHRSEAEAALQRLIRVDAELWPFAIARVYARRDRIDDAFRWLDQAYAQRDSEMPLMIRGHPFFARVRQDPRYSALMRRMNLPE